MTTDEIHSKITRYGLLGVVGTSLDNPCPFESGCGLEFAHVEGLIASHRHDTFIEFQGIPGEDKVQIQRITYGQDEETPDEMSLPDGPKVLLTETLTWAEFDRTIWEYSQPPATDIPSAVAHLHTRLRDARRTLRLMQQQTLPGEHIHIPVDDLIKGEVSYSYEYGLDPTSRTIHSSLSGKDYIGAATLWSDLKGNATYHGLFESSREPAPRPTGKLQADVASYLAFCRKTLQPDLDRIQSEKQKRMEHLTAAPAPEQTMESTLDLL